MGKEQFIRYRHDKVRQVGLMRIKRQLAEVEDLEKEGQEYIDSLKAPKSPVEKPLENTVFERKEKV